MDYRIVTPAEAVVSVAIARAQLKIDDATEDAQLKRWILAAQRYAQGYCGRPLGNQTVGLILPAFARTIKLPFSPVKRIKSFKYIDTAGGLQTLDASAYLLNTYSDPNTITAAYGTDWPDARCVPNAVQIEYTAGYGDNVPEDAIQAILLLVGHFDRNRSAASLKLDAIPFGVGSLLDGIRQYDGC